MTRIPAHPLEAWREEVVDAVKVSDYRYMRSPRHDRLLAVLFPEMAAGLEKPFGRRPSVPDLRWDSDSKRFVPKFTQRPARPADFLSRKPLTPDPLRRGGGDDIKSWLLKGAELEAWRRANPEAAADWAETLRRYGED